MKFEKLLSATSGLACFDFALLAQLEGVRRENLHVQLSRWLKQGKVRALRRGMYCIAEPYVSQRRVAVAFSNVICAPSYLSNLWALGFYDLIPERVVEFTAVTTRVPHFVENVFGRFSYRHIKPAAFFGYNQQTYSGVEINVAEPEKALLDHWYFSIGEWTLGRLAEMRYQNFSLVKSSRLLDFAERFESPRLIRTAKRWLTLCFDESDSGDEVL